jgi:hypothetical protein
MAAVAAALIAARAIICAFIDWICSWQLIGIARRQQCSVCDGSARISLLRSDAAGDLQSWHLLSLGGLAFAIGGVWSRGAPRWHAPILSLGMLFLWLIWASAE